MITHFAAVRRTQIIITCSVQDAVNDIKGDLTFKKTVFSPFSNSLCHIRTDKKFQPYVAGEQTFHIIKITEGYHISRPLMSDILCIRICHCLIIHKNNVQYPIGFHRQRCKCGGILNKFFNFCRIRPDAALWQLPRISRFHLHFRCFRLYDMQYVHDAY